LGKNAFIGVANHSQVAVKAGIRGKVRKKTEDGLTKKSGKGSVGGGRKRKEDKGERLVGSTES